MKNLKTILGLIVIIIFAFSKCIYSQIDKKEIIDTFNKYEELNTKLINSVKDSSNNYWEIRKECEAFAKNEFNPILNDLYIVVCQKKDRELLSRFLKLLNHISNSADESPINILGKIFICIPDMTINIIQEFDNNEYLINILEFGFLNVGVKDKFEFDLLKSKIDLLKVHPVQMRL